MRLSALAASMRTGAVAAVCGLAAMCVPVARSQAQILDFYGTSLTSVKVTATTPVQDVRPRFDQRGVNLDGTLRAPAVWGGSVAGNSMEGGVGGRMLGDVDLVTGNYSVTDIDLVLPSKGLAWVIGRTFSQVQVDNAGPPAHVDSAGPNGVNWFQQSQPELRVFDNDSNAGTRQAADLVYLVYGADRYLEFKRTDADVDTFKGVNGVAGVVLYASGSPDTYTYTDQRGNRMVFFGGNATSGGYDASWQLWKMTDPAGNVTYVGHASTAASAITSGYETDGRIKRAYDASGRRYCYTYSGGLLTSVLVETDGGDGWGACGEDTFVASVAYSYYSGSDANGPDDYLKLVTITTPLSPSSTNLVRDKYYRYYTEEYDEEEENRQGGPGMLKMVVGYEGCRRYDWSGDTTFDDDFLGATDNALKPYADAFFSYASGSDWKIKTAFFAGECGCSGGADGEYVITYDPHGSYGTRTGDTSYTNTWSSRAIIDQPDSGWTTVFFDETGQVVLKMLSDASPASSPTIIGWEWQRTSSSPYGIVTRVVPPEMLGAYTHATGTFSYIGTSGIGSEAAPEQVPSGGLTGFKMADRVATTEGDMTPDYLSYREMTERALLVSSVPVGRPVLDKSRAYHTATDDYTDAYYDETVYSYDWHSATDTDPLYLAVKRITTTAPTVTAAKNGLDASTATVQYLRADGTVALTKSATGIYTYTARDGYNQVSKRIGDAQTNHGSDFGSDDPNGVWSITETADGLRYVTTYTYDAQGRSSSTTLPDGRVTRMYYTKLADGRMVTLSIPREVAGSPTYYGPVSYTVTNHAGKVEFQGVIGISDSGSTTALSSWIDKTDADPITAVDVGTLERMSTTIYSETGNHTEETRVYHTIPGSGAGSSGTNFDRTVYGHDDMGRTWRVKQAHGTISRTVFDWAGRATESWMGTNDYSFSGGELSGPDNMTKTETRTYNAHGQVVVRTVDPDGDWDNTGTGGHAADDRRITTTYYDARNRPVLVANALPPHSVTKYDNLGRVVAVATYNATTGLSAATDPVSVDTADSGNTDRLTLSETEYDQRGQAWKSTRWEINQSNGATGSSLVTEQWFDADGRNIKTDGGQLVKTRYDRLGRVTHRFTLANTDDDEYIDADDVAGDTVVEEQQTVYDNVDNTGYVMFTASISRHYNDIGAGATTGELDKNAEGPPANEYKLTAGDLNGRAQITAMWYDALGRVTDTVAYGTNGNSDWDRRPSGWLSVPSRSDTELRTTTAYNTDGTVKETTDPKALVTRFEYDDAGRQTAVIENYVNGTPEDAADKDDDRTIRYAYTNGLRTSYKADVAGTDQETVYTYGTTKGTLGSGSPVESQVATGHLLHHVAYPDTSGGSDVVTYAYDALSEQVWMKDQAGNVVQTGLDKRGRQTDRKATTIGGSFDSYVQHIQTTYDSRGMVDIVRQRADTTGSGTIRDELQYTYDGWGNLTEFEQDVDGAIGAGGRGAFSVEHAYTTNTSGRNTIRRTSTTLPGTSGGFVITYDYSSSSGSLANDLSRVSSLSYNSAQRVAYEYSGLAQLASTDLLEPDVRSRLVTPPGSVTNPPTAPTYDHTDRFGRVVSSRWTDYAATATDLYRVDLAYDRNSNITTADDLVMTPGTNGMVEWDAVYSMDNLNRLKRAKEGHLATGAISESTPNDRDRDERWMTSGGDSSLSPTGNWQRRRLDLNGDGDFTDAGEIDDTGTFNDANEWLTRDTDTNSSVNYTLAHDAVGNMTDDGKDYTYKYDAFGRLTEVRSKAGGTPLVAEYRYNGLGYRIGWHYDADADGSVESGSPGDDPWYWLCHDEKWRIVATFRYTDTSARERFAWNAAGLDGSGGSSYIDSVAMRDRNIDDGWRAAPNDDTMEERAYYCQNWRADVSVIVDASGNVLERVKYSAYGVPMCISLADFNGDGQVDGNDYSDYVADYSAPNTRADVDFDGDVDINDYNMFNTAYDSGNGEAGGRAVLSRASVANRIGYAGYQWDPSITGSGVNAGKYHVRNRVLNSELGRWTRRDPLGYVEETNIYSYSRGFPLRYRDALGLKSVEIIGEMESPRPSPVRCNPKTCTIVGVTLSSSPLGETWSETCKECSIELEEYMERYAQVERRELERECKNQLRSPLVEQCAGGCYCRTIPEFSHGSEFLDRRCEVCFHPSQDVPTCPQDCRVCFASDARVKVERFTCFASGGVVQD
jgi:RHS repeat-associated protein